MFGSRVDANDRGVSPVVGIALLLVIVAIMGAVVGVALLGFGSDLKEPAPIFSMGGKQLDLGVSNNAIDSQELVLKHRGGQPVQVASLKIALDDGSGKTWTTPSVSGDVADGVWSVGEKLRIPVNTSEVCDGSGKLDVQLVYKGQSSYVVGETTVPIAKGGFTIQDGSIVPATDYSATATVLGAGFTYGAGGPNIDIRLDVVIGNTSFDPWPGNINDNGNPRTHTFSDQPANAAIKVAATGDKNGIYIAPRTRWSNASNGWVYVLRDGDSPPNIGAFGNQNSASSYVAPYLDGNGKISLNDNQAIYLFELGNSKTGSAADFQDVVVLVSLQTQASTTATQTTTSGNTVVVCPA